MASENTEHATTTATEDTAAARAASEDAERLLALLSEQHHEFPDQHDEEHNGVARGNTLHGRFNDLERRIGNLEGSLRIFDVMMVTTVGALEGVPPLDLDDITFLEQDGPTEDDVAAVQELMDQFFPEQRQQEESPEEHEAVPQASSDDGDGRRNNGALFDEFVRRIGEIIHEAVIDPDELDVAIALEAVGLPVLDGYANPAQDNNVVVLRGRRLPRLDESESYRNGGFGAVPASAAAVAALEKRIFRAGGGGNDDGCCGGLRGCAICLDEEFEEGQELSVMPCSQAHAFHTQCITAWLGQSNMCPLCRHALPTSED
ncbi:hypothetical protein EJB05_29520, partial [Eragrostis curvula]